MKTIKNLISIIGLVLFCNCAFAQANVIQAAAGTDITTTLQTDLNTYNEVIIDGSLGYNVINTTITVPAGVKLRGINNATIKAATSISGTLSSNMRYFLFPATTSFSSIHNITLMPSASGFSSLTTYSLSAIYIQGPNNEVDHCTFTFAFSYGKDVYAVWVDSPAALHNKITNNNCTTVGIQYAENGASYTYCANNYVLNSGRDGLQGTGNNADSIACKGNIVVHNIIKGAGYSGIEDQQYTDGNIIAYNNIISSGQNSVFGNRMGISAVGPNTQVIGNKVTGFGTYGIEVTGGLGLLVKDNMVTDTTNTWPDIFINSITPNKTSYRNGTTVANNTLIGGTEGIHHEGNYNVLLDVSGNRIKDPIHYGIYFASDSTWSSANIVGNMIDFTKPNTMSREGIYSYSSSPSTAGASVTISKNIITYDIAARGGSSADLGILAIHAGALITDNVVNTHNNTNSGSSPIYAYATNGAAADGVKFRDNKMVGSGNVTLSSFTNLTQTGNSWPGGDKSGGVYASSDLTGKTAAVASVATYTNSGLVGTFRISGYVNITAISTDVIQLQVSYTDENSTARTAIFYPVGKTTPGLSTTGNTVFPPIDIRCKASTAITVATTLTTGGGSITYDTGATITQLR